MESLVDPDPCLVVIYYTSPPELSNTTGIGFLGLWMTTASCIPESPTRNGKRMLAFTKSLDAYVAAAREMMDTILANIVLLGQIPAATYHEAERSKWFLERLAEFQVDECTTDGYDNPVGIIHGSSQTKAPIFVVAHMDTDFGGDIDHNYTIGRDTISGAGLQDNSLGVGILTSLPVLLRRLDLRFESDIVLAGVIQSIGKGNLRGIRYLLKTWPSRIRGAICIESGELGRLNYYSNGMSRCEITCRTDASRHGPPSNAIVVINEVIRRIRELPLPPIPFADIILGTIRGGLKHGQIADQASLGLEIRSDCDDMVAHLYNAIRDITHSLGKDFNMALRTKTISNVRAAGLHHDHPLVQSAREVMDQLEITPMVGSNESELSVFLSHHIPALTLGITQGTGYRGNVATMQIDPIFKGIAQVIGVLQAIDRGVCDEPSMD